MNYEEMNYEEMNYEEKLDEANEVVNKIYQALRDRIADETRIEINRQVQNGINEIIAYKAQKSVDEWNSLTVEQQEDAIMRLGITGINVETRMNMFSLENEVIITVKTYPN